jgi:hypothetical protein
VAYTVAELRGFLGEDANETPALTPLPWDLDKPAAGPSAAEARERKWGMASTVIGVLGGLLGIVLSYQALRGK